MPTKTYKGFSTYQTLNEVASLHGVDVMTLLEDGFLYHHAYKGVWVLEDELHGPSRGCPGCLGDGTGCGLGFGCYIKKEK